MTADPARVLYIHGFNSSPQSEKARTLARYCQECFPHLSPVIPALPHDPLLAMAQLEALMQSRPPPTLLIGSSLGGYYATWLAEKYRVKAALINPAVSPWRHLSREFLGPQRNFHTGEEYEILPRHVESLRALEVERISRPRDFLLLAQTGDEVLDYRLAVEKYAGARQVVMEGGSHGFDGFEDVLPQIFAFAGLTGGAAQRYSS